MPVKAQGLPSLGLAGETRCLASHELRRSRPVTSRGKIVKSLTSVQLRQTYFPAETQMAAPTASDRFLLWIDAVGGYLVCPEDNVRIGQQSPGNPAEVPLMADIARHHATLRRDGESYLVVPVREVLLDGRPCTGPALLGDGVELTLGRGVRLRFRQPNPLSTTARLDFVSRHGTQPTTSGVILLSETCILGPAANSHVVCRDWKSSVLLHRLRESLYCISDGPFTANGMACRGRASIEPGSRVLGEDFSFSIETA